MSLHSLRRDCRDRRDLRVAERETGKLRHTSAHVDWTVPGPRATARTCARAPARGERGERGARGELRMQLHTAPAQREQRVPRSIT